jgi:lauroyl/myristoyl acyltransferase
MPIEIKELHIKINVDEKAATTTTKSVDEAQIMRAINESVEQVVNIEQRKKER